MDCIVNGVTESDTTEQLSHTLFTVFQVYSKVIQLYIFQILFHYRLQDIEYSFLCFIEVLVIYFIYRSMYFTSYLFIPLPFPIGNYKSVFCVCFLKKFTCSVFRIPHISDIFFLLWHSMIVSRSIHVAANGSISVFYGFHIWIYTIKWYIYILYPFICWWTYMLLPCLHYCK